LEPVEPQEESTEPQ
jgi:hypothetical protein